MRPGEILDDIHRDLVPTPQELAAVQRRFDETIAHSRALIRTAEVYKAGSWAKGTMLRGRMEADVVVALADAPDSRTLDALAQHLGSLPELRRAPDTSFKSVNLTFTDGVSIDLLPVAKSGLTPSGPSIPRKLRHALAGPKHVDWFVREGHGRSTQAVVRLLKHFRNGYPGDFGDLPSFAFEVLAVNALRGTALDLYGSFSAVVSALAEGGILAGRLADPVNPNNDLLEGIGATTRQGISRRSAHAREAMAAGTFTSVFPSRGESLPPPSSNLGGKTLA